MLYVFPVSYTHLDVYKRQKYGWGFENYQKEANIGKGLKVPHWVKFYVTIILPIIVIFVFINGII